VLQLKNGTGTPYIVSIEYEIYSGEYREQLQKTHRLEICINLHCPWVSRAGPARSLVLVCTSSEHDQLIKALEQLAARIGLNHLVTVGDKSPAPEFAEQFMQLFYGGRRRVRRTLRRHWGRRRRRLRHEIKMKRRRRRTRRALKQRKLSKRRIRRWPWAYGHRRPPPRTFQLGKRRRRGRFLRRRGRALKPWARGLTTRRHQGPQPIPTKMGKTRTLRMQQKRDVRERDRRSDASGEN